MGFEWKVKNRKNFYCDLLFEKKRTKYSIFNVLILRKNLNGRTNELTPVKLEDLSGEIGRSSKQYDDDDK